MKTNKKGLKKLNRWFNHLYAILGAYFWLPCPICGEYFGGHEVSGVLLDTSFSGKCICPNCPNEADKINRNNFPDIYPR